MAKKEFLASSLSRQNHTMDAEPAKESRRTKIPGPLTLRTPECGPLASAGEETPEKRSPAPGAAASFGTCHVGVRSRHFVSRFPVLARIPLAKNSYKHEINDVADATFPYCMIPRFVKRSLPGNFARRQDEAAVVRSNLRPSPKSSCGVDLAKEARRQHYFSLQLYISKPHLSLRGHADDRPDTPPQFHPRPPQSNKPS